MLLVNRNCFLRTTFFLWLILLPCLTPLNLQARNAIKITGTYTNMHFNTEGGDLLGQELKVVSTHTGYQGALQFAEGGGGSLIIVDIDLKGDKMAFDIPDMYPDAGHFSGTLRNGVIRGVFRFKGGGEEKVTLKRGKSYWD